MRIGLTAGGQRIQAPFEWDEAKPCSSFREPGSGGLTSPASSATHPCHAPRLGLWMTSPDSISA